MTNEHENGITLVFDGKKLFLKTALVGGITGDALEAPMGMYAGKVDVGEIGVALMHTHRAILKIMQDSFHMELDKAVDFIRFCCMEAAHREQHHDTMENVSFEEHHHNLLRMTKDNS